jgi:hypothetical protein
MVTKCRVGIDEMSSWEVNQVVDKYMMAKKLPMGERSPALVDRLLDTAGLLDDPELLVQLEVAHQEAQRLQQMQAEAKQINFKRNNRGR